MAEPRRLLFVSPELPFGGRSGAQQRTALLYHALREIADVDVLQLSPGPTVAVERLAEHAAAVVCRAEREDTRRFWRRYQASPALTEACERALGRPLSSYSAIVARRQWQACQLCVPATVPLIVDLDDFRYRYTGLALRSPSLLLTSLGRRLTHLYARRQLDRVAGAFFVSAQDRDESAGVPSVLLPNIPFHILPAAQISPVGGKRVLFVGSLWYGPNKYGVDWLLAHVWPAVRLAEPEAELVLVGAAAPSQRALWSTHAGVQAPGFVEDLAQMYGSTALVVAPIHYGGGSNIKVLEAMAHGRPCLTTRFAQQAFGAEFVAQEHLLVADDAFGFTAQIVSGLRAPERLARVGSAGHALVTRLLTKERFAADAVDFVRFCICNATTLVISQEAAGTVAGDESHGQA